MSSYAQGDPIAILSHPSKFVTGAVVLLALGEKETLPLVQKGLSVLDAQIPGGAIRVLTNLAAAAKDSDKAPVLTELGRHFGIVNEAARGAVYIQPTTIGKTLN